MHGRGITPSYVDNSFLSFISSSIHEKCRMKSFLLEGMDDFALHVQIGSCCSPGDARNKCTTKMTYNWVINTLVQRLLYLEGRSNVLQSVGSIPNQSLAAKNDPDIVRERLHMANTIFHVADNHPFTWCK